MALGHAAEVNGVRVRFFAAADLVENLDRCMPKTRSPRSSTTCCALSLVIVDELGFTPSTHEEAGLRSLIATPSVPSVILVGGPGVLRGDGDTDLHGDRTGDLP
jgi:hypothetical protein